MPLIIIIKTNTNEHAAIYLLLTSDEIFMELGCSNGFVSYFNRWFIIRLTRCAVSAAKEQKYKFSFSRKKRFVFCDDAGFRSNRIKRFYFRLHLKHLCRVDLLLLYTPAPRCQTKLFEWTFFPSFVGASRAVFFSLVYLFNAFSNKWIECRDRIAGFSTLLLLS